MAEKRRKKKSNQSELLPTGSTVLNCMLADNPFYGYRRGTIANLIGDSSAGKSILAHTTFAAMDIMGFDDYDFILDDSEFGSGFDTFKLFGKAAERMKAPTYDDAGNPVFSDTIEDFHYYVHKTLKRKKPVIYVLDSFDAVTSEQDRDKTKNKMKAREQGKDSPGNYGTAKAREMSNILKDINYEVKKTSSLIIIVSQVRENLNAGSFGSNKTRSGGLALKHWSWHEIWLYLNEKIKAEVDGKKYVIGANTQPRVSKNRQTGKVRDGNFPIYYDYGVDDLGANIEYLLSHKHWNKKKSTIVAPEFDFEGNKRSLIQYIEKNNLETEVQKLVGEKWNEIEETLKLSWRKKRF